MRMRTCTDVVFVLAFGLIACSDHTTDPGPNFNVAINANTATPVIGQDASGQPQLTCAISLDATAEGKGTANWLDAVFRLYFGTDRSVVVDSGTIDASGLQQAWGSSSIGSSQTEHSVWHLSANVPFSGDFEFHYSVVGSTTPGVRKVVVPVTCVLAATTQQPPPTISGVTTSPASGNLSTDSSLTVSYNASSAAGLWLTQVHVSGPCDVRQVFAEGLHNSVSHTVKLPFPNTCSLGVPLTVAITAMDGAAQEKVQTVQLPLSLADLDPPTIAPLFFLRAGGGAQPVASGDYFAGDSITFIVNAADNRKLASVSWLVMPFGTSDFVVANSPGISQRTGILVQPTWTGPMQISFSAVDSVGLTTNYVTPPDSLRLHPTVSRSTQLGTVPGANGLLAIDSRRGVIYMLEYPSQQIAVVSMSTLQVLSTIPVPGEADDIALTPHGDSLVIAFYGLPQLGIVDLRQPMLAVTTMPIVGLDTALHQWPLHLAVLANGHALVGTTGNTQSAWTLLDVDLTTGIAHTRGEIAVNGVIGEVLMQGSADGSAVALAEQDARCLRRYATATDTFSACVTNFVLGVVPTIDATGDRILLNQTIYDASMQPLPSGLNLTPGGVAYGAISSDGQLYYQLFTFGVVRRNANNGSILDRSLIPAFNLNMTPRISPDGNTLVIIDKENTFTKLGLIDMR